MRIIQSYLLSVLLLANLLLAGSDANEAPATSAAWTVSSQMSAPESAYFDSTSNTIFVSNVVGQADQKDGEGWIHKLSPKGDLIEAKWVKGLNAPKGLRAHKGVLWVSDIDELVSIEISSGRVLKKIAVPGAKFLNDVAVDADGVVYVSDTIGSKIFRVEGGKPAVFVEGKQLESPNGLLLQDGKLIVAAWGLTTDWTTKVPGRLFSLDLKSKKQTFITQKPLGNLDGLERDRRGNFLVSDWAAGKVYRVSPMGKVELLLSGFKGSADIGYISESDTLIVPRMGENSVSGYQLSTPRG